MASDGGGGGALDGEEGWGVGTRVSPLPDFASPQPQLQIVNTTTITTTTIEPAVDREQRSQYGGGAGGKSRAVRKSAKKSLPYERPLTGRHAAAGPQAAAFLGSVSTQALAEKAQGAKAWLGSGFSKIITTGATYLYSSIFRRNLPALPALDVEAHQSDADEQVSSPSVGAEENQGGNLQNGIVEKPDHMEPQLVNSTISDVERLFKQETLSREEFQRLTEILQSRVVTNGVPSNGVPSNGVERQQKPKHVEFDVRASRQEVHPSVRTQTEAQRWRQDLKKAREERENAVRTLTVYENGGPSSAPQAGGSQDVDAMNSSPVEVAIAFMGGRGSRLGETPSVNPLNQRDENRMSIGPPPSPSPPQTTLARWSAPDFLNEEQFSTPPPPSVHSWGHNRTMSRTPYSRPLRLPPSREKAIDGTFGTPSVNRWTPIRTPITGGREMLKRRSTVLDEGWSSGGPIRRTRQKALVPAAPSNLSQSRGLAFPATLRPSSSLLTFPSQAGGTGGKLSAASSPRRNAGKSPTREKNEFVASGNFFVPAQSSETARKILETLERMTPSPQGKSLANELAFVRERQPTPLTESMLNDQARKSMAVVEYTPPSDSREPGPSGRSAENESPSLGHPGSSFKMFDSTPKVKGKGKGPLTPTENGPGEPAGLFTGQEKISTADGSVKQVPVRPKETVIEMASENEKGKGFRMSAVFEESGSEDEGRSFNKRAAASPISSPKLPIATSTSSLPSASAAPSLTNTSGAGTPSFSVGLPAIDTLKAFSSGFTFPTKSSLEGPPTPKAMSPATTSPKATPSSAPFFQFAQTSEPPVSSGKAVEANSTPSKAEPKPENKTEFSFSSPARVANSAQTVAKSPGPFESSSNIFKQSAPSMSSLSSAGASALFPTFMSSGASTTSAPTSSKFGDTFSAPASTTTLKTAVIASNSTPFGQLFTSNSGSVQSASGTAPSTNLFASNSGSGTSPIPSLFGNDFKTLTSTAPSPLSSGFAQVSSFAFKSTSSMLGPLVSPDSQTVSPKDSGPSLSDPDRPQKRSLSSFQQEPIKQQQSSVTISSHMFTTFGSNIGTSAATPAMPVTFAAGTQNSSASQGLFSVPSFGQGSSSAAQTASKPPTPAPPFAFGLPPSTAGSTSSASSLAGFGSTPSFPSFSGSVFGATASGNAFGLAPAAGSTPAAAPASSAAPAPLPFGSTAAAPLFGSASAKSVFGGFATEAGSQPSPTPVFGSGFTLPSPATTSAFTFGGSSTAFSFGPSATSTGSAFTFGSAGSGGSFPFGANKSGPPSPVFGLASSVPAFGSTTNGTMANDVAVNDQSNMDDNSMAEEPPQMSGSVSPQPSIFGAQSSPGAGSFVFGAHTGVPAATGQPLFGGFSSPANPAGFAAAPLNPFAAPQPGGSLDFAGGSFTLGSGGDRPQRKMFKAKRTGAKRGK